MELVITEGLVGYRWELDTGSETFYSSGEWLTMDGAAGDAQRVYDEWIDSLQDEDCEEPD